MANTVVGFSINIDGISNINDLNQAIKDTEKVMKTLDTTTKEYADNAKKLAALKAEQKGIKKQQDDLNKSFMESSNALGAYDKASAKLNRLRKEFKDLAIAGNGSSKSAKELLKEIQALDTQLKETDAQVGQYQRNVGNYGSAFQDIAGNLGGIGDFAGKAVGGVQALGAAFKAALGPIGLLIAAIGIIVAGIKEFFNGSEEGQNKLRRLQAVFTVVFDNLMDILEMVGEYFVNIFENPIKAIQDFGKAIQENIMNRFEGILEYLPQMGKAIGLLFQGEFQKAGQVALDATAKIGLGVENFTKKATDGFKNMVSGIQDMVKETQREIEIQNKLSTIQDNLDKRTRAALVENARLQQQVAENRNKAAQTEKYSNEERLKFLDKAIAAELQTLKNNEEIAATKLYLAQQQENLDTKGKTGLMEIAQLEADLIGLRTQNLEETKRIIGQRAELIKSLKEEADVTKKYIDEAAQFQLGIVEKTSKLVTDLIQNEYEKRRQAAKENSDAEINDIQKSLEAEKKSNQEKLKELQDKFGIQSIQAQEFQNKVAEIEKQNINQLDAYKVEREKTLSKEIIQINKEEAQAKKDIQQKYFESTLKLEQDTANILIQQKQIQFNQESALLDKNKKEDADKIIELEKQLNQDIYNITKNRITDESEIIQNELKNNVSLTQQEQEALKNRLIALKQEETENFKSNEEQKRDAIKETSDKQKEQLQKQIQNAADFTKIALDTVNGFMDAADQKRLDRLAKDEEANNMMLNNLNERLNRATGLERRYLEQQIQENRQTAERIAKEKEKVEKEAAKRKKVTAIIESIINTAVAVTQNIANPILAAITAIAGAAQTAVIAAQPLAKGGVVGKGDDIVQFAEGGKVTSRGNIKPLSNGDNVLATLKTGEIVLNEAQQKRIGYGTLKAAKIPNFAAGGYVGAPTSLITSANNSVASEQMRVNVLDEMIKATNSRMDRLTVVYSATTDYEVEKGRNDKKTIKANSTF